jgi:hypothetical protein
MNAEQMVESELPRETEVLGKNPPKFHFVHHKFHMTWPGAESRPYWSGKLGQETAYTNNRIVD